MTRTWQGKGLMAGIVLPALFLCFLYLADEHPQRGIWMLFCAVIISAVFATSVAFMLIPTLVGVAALLLAWRKHSIRILLQMEACCIFAVCYLMRNKEERLISNMKTAFTTLIEDIILYNNNRF